MNRIIIIPDTMECAMQKDLDKLRDSLPINEQKIFEAERKIYRQQLIDHYAEYGTYPEISGIEKRGK